MRLRDIVKAKVSETNEANYPLLIAIDAYIMNARTPHAGKLAAMKKLDEVIGLPPNTSTSPEYALKVYMALGADDLV